MTPFLMASLLPGIRRRQARRADSPEAIAFYIERAVAKRLRKTQRHRGFAVGTEARS